MKTRATVGMDEGKPQTKAGSDDLDPGWKPKLNSCSFRVCGSDDHIRIWRIVGVMQFENLLTESREKSVRLGMSIVTRDQPIVFFEATVHPGDRAPEPATTQSEFIDGRIEYQLTAFRFSIPTPSEALLPVTPTPTFTRIVLSLPPVTTSQYNRTNTSACIDCA